MFVQLSFLWVLTVQTMSRALAKSSSEMIQLRQFWWRKTRKIAFAGRNHERLDGQRFVLKHHISFWRDCKVEVHSNSGDNTIAAPCGGQTVVKEASFACEKKTGALSPISSGMGDSLEFIHNVSVRTVALLATSFPTRCRFLGPRQIWGSPNVISQAYINNSADLE